ncbi:glycosyltransferase family 9 protein [Acerihabitans arboris]|uniref:Glycosyl transferase family 9 n=1 Tax=Acerihabitans arboris TaxID=2691583 RepID=A0A845SGA8_9GAMM|nr:glycosyltransferase family 9 protein [Acerihabitans arboris]NDL63890.1 glycosyl transferase family 9 [Acerihabitans arboris]
MRALVVCRDNIGDTLLTTPLISALAKEGGYRVDVLANSYNAGVLARNPDISKVYVYQKIHHRAAGESRIGIILRRLNIMWHIRRTHYDIALMAKSRWDPRVLKWGPLSGAGRILALGDRSHPAISDLVTPPDGTREHLVRRFHRMLAPLGIRSPAGPLVLSADPAAVAALSERYGIDADQPVIGLQISARRILQRWPEANFVALARLIAAAGPCRIILLWSPGAADNPTHPGDDDLAARIAAACDLPCLTPIATHSLDTLMAAMQLCDSVVTSDGGAMHIAAGLGKGIIALFGDSDPVCWAPWQVPHSVLQAGDSNVASISPRQVHEALRQLKPGARQAG